MSNRQLVSFAVMLISPLLASNVLADAHGSPEPQVQPAASTHKSSVNVAEQATDPSAVLTQLGFFYWTDNEKDTDQSTETFLFQPVLPLSKNNVLRPALPVVQTNGLFSNETGIGDLFLLDIFLFQTTNATWGIGPVASLPVASKDEFGTGKTSIGPAAMYMYKGVPKNLFGILGYNETSVGGDSDRDDVNVFSFQPIWVMHFNWGYIGWTDQVASIDWENDNEYSIPVGLRFGKVFKGKTPLNLAIQPYYTFNDVDDDVYGIKISATFIKPGWLNW
jgi:hypothetical protein